jgi:hypothetical protein
MAITSYLTTHKSLISQLDELAYRRLRGLVSEDGYFSERRKLTTALQRLDPCSHDAGSTPRSASKA